MLPLMTKPCTTASHFRQGWRSHPLTPTCQWNTMCASSRLSAERSRSLRPEVTYVANLAKQDDGRINCWLPEQGALAPSKPLASPVGPCRALPRRPLRVLAAHSPTRQSPVNSDTAAKFCGLAAAGLLLLGHPGVAAANASKVAEFAASGLIFKDSVELLALDDKEVAGVTIYITDFKRSLTEKLARDFFAEPSQASLTCAITGPVSIANPDKIKGYDGTEIFSERKNALNFLQNKTLRVRRIYDEKHNALVYVAYNTRFTNTNDEGISTGRYRTSICVLPLATAPSLVAEAPGAVPESVPAQ